MIRLIRFWNLGLIANEIPLFYENLTLFIWIAVALAVVSYFVGSVNFSLLISKMYGKDVRDGGSGNAGATNMTRQFGKKAGALTFLGDFFKAFLLSAVGLLLAGIHGSLVAGLFCIIGHAFPIYFKFRGGKGFSSMVAIMIVTNPIVFAVVGSIYLILLFGTKMVSFAAVMTMLIYPFVMNTDIGGGPGLHVLLASLCALLIIFLHRKNIVRIFNHTEPKIDFSKKKKKVEAPVEQEIEEASQDEEESDEKINNSEEETDENSEK